METSSTLHIDIDNSASVPVLIGKLVNLHLPNRRTWFHRQVGVAHGCRYLGDSVKVEVATTKKLKSIAFDVLFQYLLNSQKLRRIDSELTERERLLEEVFLLRRRRRFDQAQRLEDLSDNLGADKLNDTVKSVLSLVLALHGSGTSDECRPIGHQDNFSHLFTRSDKENSVCLPAGPSMYGDTLLVGIPSANLYMHYPKEIFTVSSMNQFNLSRSSSAYFLSSSQIFSAAPGSSTFCADSTTVLHDPVTESSTDLVPGSAQNLYGALVQSRLPALSSLKPCRLDIRLDLPDLNQLYSDESPPELRIPKFISRMETQSEDEGFVSVAGTPVMIPSPKDPEPLTCGGGLSVSRLGEGYMWEESVDSGWEEELRERKAWRRMIDSLDVSRRYTWEQRGRPGGALREKPYLTEAGDKGFNEMRIVYLQRIKLLDSSLSDLCSTNQISDEILIDSSTLLRDVRNLLLGVSSQSFIFSENAQCFSVRRGLRVSGVSPEALQHACQTFLHTGTNLRRLHSFLVAQQSGRAILRQSVGPVLASFCEGVRAYLQQYHSGVTSLHLECEPSLEKRHGVEVLLELNLKIRKAVDQIRFLAQLCKCEYEQDMAADSPEFPKGVKLLNYLYSECGVASFTPHSLLMLSLFRRAFTPYLMIIHDWTFHGQLYDVNEEFLVLANQNYLHCRDRRYWTNGYQLNEAALSSGVEHPEHSMPPEKSFLSEISRDVYTCGKSLNLLRSCNSKHFMFDGSLDVERPQLSLTFSPRVISHLESMTETYGRRMRSLAAQHSRTREEMLRRVEQAKRELIQKAAASAAKELQRIQNHIQSDKQKRQDKRKKELDDLKQQMEEHKKYREDKIKREKEEDKATADTQGFLPGVGPYIDPKLERQVKQQLIEYYERLTSDTVHREQRALWRVQRHQLDKKREKFLLLSARYLEEELQRGTEELAPLEQSPLDDRNMLKTSDVESTEISIESSADGLTLASNVTAAIDSEMAGKVLPSSEAERRLPQWAQTDASVKSVNGDKSQKSEKSGGREAWNVPAPSVSLPVWALEALESESGYLVSHGYDDIDDDDECDGNTSLTQAIQEATGLNDSIQEGLRVLVSMNEVIGKLDFDSLDAANEDVGKDSESQLTDSEIQPKSDTADFTRKSANTESEEVPSRSHITMVPGKSSVVESEEAIPKQHMSMVPGVSSSTESKEQASRPHTATVAGKFSTAETTQEIVKPHIASVEGKSTSIETTEQPVKPHIASVEGKSSTAETESKLERPHTATVTGRGSTTESEEVAERRHVKMVEGKGAMKESSDGAAVWNSWLGRGERFASVQSGTPPRSAERRQRLVSRYKLTLPPQLRLNHSPSPMKHSRPSHSGSSPISEDLRSFQVKSRRRIEQDLSSVDGRDDIVEWKSHVRLNSTKSASTESDVTEPSYRPTIKLSGTMRATLESAEDNGAESVNRRSRFSAHNTHGHSSDSTVQRLLYGASSLDGNQKLLGAIPEENSGKTDELVITSRVEPYTVIPTSFDLVSRLGEPAFILQPTQAVFNSLPTDYDDDKNDDDVDDIRDNLDVFLPAVIKRTIVSPILAQVSIVNQSIVNYFLADVRVNDHFKVLRSFLLLEDGEFAQSLCEQIFNKLAEGSTGRDILNPAYLNQVLHRAIVNSVHGDSALSRNVSFLLSRQLNKSLLDSDILQSLDLTYKVDWPANIIITDSQLRQYSHLFQFLLLVKRATWLLQDMFYRLKREAVIHAGSINESEMRSLQLYRHRMQHFVRGLQEYVSNQVIYVSWHEFQTSLSSSVNSLDDLIDCHSNYLNKCITRCLLNKKAAQVQKIISDILSRISTFNLQLSHIQWSAEKKEIFVEGGAGAKTTMTHLRETYEAFHQRSLFLYKVIRSLAAKGYEPHMDELLLRLNFNSFYQ